MVVRFTSSCSAIDSSTVGGGNDLLQTPQKKKRRNQRSSKRKKTQQNARCLVIGFCLRFFPRCFFSFRFRSLTRGSLTHYFSARHALEETFIILKGLSKGTKLIMVSIRRALVECVALSLQDNAVFYPCCKGCFSKINVKQRER